MLTSNDLLYTISELKKTSPEHLIRLKSFLDDAFFLRLRLVTVFNFLFGVGLFFWTGKTLFKATYLKRDTIIGNFFKELPFRVYLISALLLVIKIVLSHLMPLTTDELFNFNNYIIHGPFVSLSFGIGPNNHVMHTFLSSVIYTITGLPKFSVRAVEIIVLGFFFLVFLKKYSVTLGLRKSVLVLLILNFSIDFFWQSTISRGYVMLFVFSFFYLHYCMVFWYKNEKSSLNRATGFGVLATCVLPVFLLFPIVMLIFTLVNKRKLAFVFFKQGMLILLLSFVFYEPIVVFSGKHFLLGNNWIHAETNFKEQFFTLIKELNSLNGFGFWLIGLIILLFQVIGLKRQPVAQFSLLLWGIIIVISLVFQYTPPVRVFILALSVSFLFIAELTKKYATKYALLAAVVMALIFGYNFQNQVFPVYAKYRAMEKIVSIQPDNKVFTNSDLYYNKLLFLHLTQEYPRAIYSTDRISKLKYLILKTETRLSETDKKDYVLLMSNSEINLYKRNE